jgi:hypothetical protein
MPIILDSILFMNELASAWASCTSTELFSTTFSPFCKLVYIVVGFEVVFLGVLFNFALLFAAPGLMFQNLY